MPRADLQKWASIVICVLGTGYLLWLCGRFLFFLFLPFGLALGFSVATRRVVVGLARRTGWREGACAVFVTVPALFGLFWLMWLVAAGIFSQLQQLLYDLLARAETPDGGFARLTETLSRLPIFEKLRANALFEDLVGDPQVFLSEQLRRGAGEIAGGFAEALRRVLQAAPSFLLGIVITVISCLYFAADYRRVTGALVRLLPARLREKLPAWRSRGGAALSRYVRAYFLLFLLTFAELTLGFLLLRRPYPFLLAFLTAVLDILPVLGVGTVLIPYAALQFLTGNAAVGAGLLVLYAVITLVRQVAEPHLVGKSLGLHPILMLASFYVGLRLFGFAGLLTGPLFALALQAFLTARKTEAT